MAIPTSMNTLRDSMTALWRQMTIQQRWLMTVSVVLLFVGLALWIFAGRAPAYVPLFTKLSLEDSGDVVAKLKEAKTPYQLAAGGATILVPEPALYETRLLLATKGVPRGGGAGFELFDKTNLGQTEFGERVEYQRALQGELARTIMTLNSVEDARVHLAIPEPQIFADQHEKPRAAVVLKLKQGATLSDGEVQGIVHLVATSVPELSSEDVSVISDGGRVLWDTIAGDRQASARTLGQHEQDAQARFQENLETGIRSMLEPIYGAGHVVVRVAAAMDFDHKDIQAETFGADQNGAAPDSPGSPPPTGSTVHSRKTVKEVGGTRLDEAVEYDVNHQVVHTEVAPGTIIRLRVGVVVDSRTRAPVSPDQIRHVVTLAAGIDPKRGDDIEITMVPFQADQAEALAPPPSRPASSDGVAWWPPALLALGVVLLIGLWLSKNRTALAPASGSWPGGNGDGSRTPAPEPEPVGVAVQEWMKERS